MSQIVSGKNWCVFDCFLLYKNFSDKKHTNPARNPTYEDDFMANQKAGGWVVAANFRGGLRGLEVRWLVEDMWQNYKDQPAEVTL